MNELYELNQAIEHSGEGLKDLAWRVDAVSHAFFDVAIEQLNPEAADQSSDLRAIAEELLKANDAIAQMQEALGKLLRPKISAAVEKEVAAQHELADRHADSEY